MSTELDTLLGEGEGDGKPAGTPPEKNAKDPDIQKIVEAEVAKVTEGFKGRINTLQERNEAAQKEIERLTSVTKPLENLIKPEEKTGDDLSSAEGWKNYVDKVGENAANESKTEVEKIKQSATRKAITKFVASHKDYDPGTEAGKQKLEQVLQQSKKLGVDDEFDEDSVLKSLNKSWAADNFESLQASAVRAAQFQVENDNNINDLSTSGASDPVKTVDPGTEASKADWGAYREYQKAGGTSDIATFLKISRQL